MTFYRRLNKEYIKIKDINDPLIKISLYDEDDLRSWRCFLKGPPDSPFENGIFEISINVTNSYPIEPPKCKFMTKIFHPNIDFDSGEICLDILKENWTPSFGIYSICQSIQILLANPDYTSPLNIDAANLLRSNDMIGYKSMVQMYISEYAYNSFPITL